jgi:hypothetical protein
MKWSKQLLVTMPREEHRLLSGFLDSDMVKLWLKIVNIQVGLQRLHRLKNMERVCKIVNEDQRSSILEICWYLRSLVWNMPANSNGGLEHGADLHKVCASVTHQQAEAAACVCLPGTVE